MSNIINITEESNRLSLDSLYTPNWNSNFRLIFGLLNMEEDDDVAVVESALGHKMENIHNGIILQPDIAIMTIIGKDHFDRFNLMKGVLTMNLSELIEHIEKAKIL